MASAHADERAGRGARIGRIGRLFRPPRMGCGVKPIESTMKEIIDAFARALEREELAANTVRSYRKTVESFFRQYDKIDKRSLLSFKGFLF